MYIQKNSGSYELFDPKKLQMSLAQAGASKKEINQLVAQVQKKHPKTVRDIHEHTLEHVYKINPSVGLSYNLKQALLDLGPSGFPFEQFVAELFRRKGWKSTTNLILQGKCVTHEIDVMIENEMNLGVMECKFRNQPGSKVDVKVPLYVQSRFLDVVANIKKSHPGKPDKHYFPMITTNSKFTVDAIAYGRCMGMHLISWGYPEHGNIRELVIETGLVPITVLPHLTLPQKQFLIGKGVIFCHQLFHRRQYLQHMGLPHGLISHILQDAQDFLKHHKIS